MLRRFYSKRSGFTLVEIIVAFAVFAIMASMIAQILELSVKARASNNQYALELARQEKILTVVEKDKDYYSDTDITGSYSLVFTDGSTIDMGYQVKAADPTLANQAEGLNYFLSNVDYSCAPSVDGGISDSDLGGMTQASRMDTRITGTAGIGGITIYEVYKDEFTYADDSPFKLAPGHTRYWFEVAASSVDADGVVTLKEEDVPYAQYRLYLFSDQLDTVKSSTEYTDSDGKTYTKDVYQEATIVDLGHIDQTLDYARNHGGLSTSFTSNGGVASSNNPYLVQKVGNNSVRIGTPFGWAGKVRLQGSKFTRFYVEFDGDPHLTTTSFGHNYTTESGNTVYRVCPQYEDDFNADGTPAYTEVGDGKVHPSIYGAYLSTRHYK